MSRRAWLSSAVALLVMVILVLGVVVVVGGF